MRFTAVLLVLSTLALADARIETSLAKGETALARGSGAEGSKLLRALEAAKPHFARARKLAAAGLEGAPGDAALTKAHADATRRLVGILNAETVIHLDRSARSLAKKRNEEALKLLPKDARALELKDTIANPEPYEPDARLVDLGSPAGRPEARTGADRRFLDRRRARLVR